MHIFFKINAFHLLFIFTLVLNSLAADPAQGSALLAKFNSSSNSVEKRELLASLKAYIPQNGQQASEWIVTLIGNGLKDENPVVVAEAAAQAGQFRLTQYVPGLIQLYNDAESKYAACGYVERVRYAIIPALGRTGTSDAKQLIVNQLKNDNGSDMGELLLIAVSDLNDPLLIKELTVYKAKMQALIQTLKQKGYDPLIYSLPQYYIELATEIEQNLLAKGGK